MQDFRGCVSNTSLSLRSNFDQQNSVRTENKGGEIMIGLLWRTNQGRRFKIFTSPHKALEFVDELDIPVEIYLLNEQTGNYEFVSLA